MALKPCPECLREVADTAPACPGCGAVVASPKKRTSPVTKALAVFFAAMGLLALIGPANPPAETAPTSRAPRPADEAGQCDERVLAAQRAGIIHEMKVEPGKVVVIMDRGVWARMDFDAKSGLTRNVACVTTRGEAGKTARVQVRDHRDNKVIGDYSGTRLTVP